MTTYKGVVTMSNRKTLHDLIDNLSDNQIDIAYRIILQLVKEDSPLPDEIVAIENARTDIVNNNLISHDKIDWN